MTFMEMYICGTSVATACLLLRTRIAARMVPVPLRRNRYGAQRHALRAGQDWE